MDAELLAKLETLEAENRLLREQLAAALKRIEELDRAAHRQAAPFRREPRGLVRPEEKKKPGSKPGHKGFFRQAPDQIDEEIDVPLDRCPRCGGELADVTEVEQIIEEIPPVRPKVYRIRTRRAACTCGCGEVRSGHPLQQSLAEGCARVQLGPRAAALAVLLNKGLGLTVRKSLTVLEVMAGLRLSPGGLSRLAQRAAEKLKGEYDRLYAELRAAPAVHADETSWYVGGPGHWLWTFTTPATTLYIVGKRSATMVADVLGGKFAGVLVSDCLASYDPADCRKHKCFAHHLRAIKSAEETAGKSEYLNRWRSLFTAANAIWRQRADEPQTHSAERFASDQQHLEKLKDQLLDQIPAGGLENKIRNRLMKHRPHLLRCLDHPAIEPTNNRAERALRPAVIARKLSCGNKTPAGQKAFEVLTSLAVTCQQRGEDFVEFLAKRLPLQVAAG